MTTDIADPAAIRAERLARSAVEELSEYQADAIAMLEVGPVTDLADYFVIASAGSRRQFNAIEDALRKLPAKVGHAGFPRREGGADGGWLLFDYGSVVVHLFDHESRERYDLDGLWSHAKTILRLE